MDSSAGGEAVVDEPGDDLETTAVLLQRVRRQEPDAMERLFARYLPMLQRWAHGRLPRYARELAETDDLVQVTLVRALNRVQHFEPRREGAFLAYLRRILLNAVREEIRRTTRSRNREPLGDDLADPAASPVERAVGAEALEAYEAALAQLPELQREAVILRLEFGFTYPEIASALERPSANSARMMVTRALDRVAERINVAG